MLLLLAIAHGVETQKDLLRVLVSFGAEVTRRNLYDDLEELTNGLWLAREKKPRENAPQFQRDWEWRYIINPRMLEKFTEEEDND